MASPFSVFRKNQKMMIATLAILAMGAFVFLDPLTSLLRRRSGASGVPDNPVVIDWVDGKVRRWDLERMLQMRNIVNYFVRRAAELGDLASGQERRSIMGFGPATEQNVVRTMVFAKAAEDFGFIVSDQVVNRFIKQITRDSVPAQRLREIVATTSIGRRRVSMGMLFDGLREELLAQELLSNYMMVASSVLPAERWIMWLRLNERATVEALPVPVSEFLDKVAEPGDVELRAFFDQYKERVKRPVAVDGTQLPSPTPGFKIPRQVVLHYLRAEFDPFVERLAAEITDEQIATYYEQNKRHYVRPELLEDDTTAPEATSTDAGATAGPAGVSPEKPAADPAPAKDGSADDTKSTDKSADKAAEQTVAAEDQGKVEQGAEEETPAQEAAEEEVTEEGTAGQGAAEEETPAQETAEEAATEEGTAGQGAAEEETPAQGAAEEEVTEEGTAGQEAAEEETPAQGAADEETPAQEVAEEETPAQEAGEKEAPGQEAGEEKAAADETTEQETGEKETPVQEAAAAEEETSAQEAAGEEAAANETTEQETGEKETPAQEAAEAETRQEAAGDEAGKQKSPAADDAKTSARAAAKSEPPAAADDSAEPKYVPLDEVRDEIRRELARQKAAQEMQRVLAPFVADMRRYYNKLQVWEVEQEEKAADEPGDRRPEPPDAQAWADQHGVLFEKTVATSYFDLRDMPVGGSVVVGEGEVLTNRAFTELADFQTVQTEDLRGNRYVVWKVADTPERVPALDEVRQQVVTAWKTMKARALAQKRAEELAEKARTAGKPLAEVFPESDGFHVSRSDPFSWLTVGPVPSGRDMRLRLSEVYGVDGAGPAFMEAVFKLPDGGVVVAMNHGQMSAYVVRLAGRERTLDAMHEDFLKQSEVYAPLVQRQNRFAVVGNLFATLREAYDVEGLELLDRPVVR